MVEYHSLITFFPEIELREKIKSIEKFLLVSVFILISYLFINNIIKFFSGYPDIIAWSLLIYLAFIGLLIYYFSFFLAELIFFYIADLQRDVLWKWKELLWNNRKKIIYPIPLFVVILMVYVVYSMHIVDIGTIILGLAIIIIELILINYKKIVAFISKK